MGQIQSPLASYIYALPMQASFLILTLKRWAHGPLVHTEFHRWVMQNLVDNEDFTMHETWYLRACLLTLD